MVIMTGKILGRIILNIVWIVIAVVFYWVSIPYADAKTLDPVGPHVFPQIMSVVIILCAGGNLLMMLLAVLKPKAVDVDLKEGKGEGIDFVSIFKVVLVIAVSGAYIFIMQWAGYLISTIMLISSLMLIQGDVGLGKNLMISVSFSLFLYIVFLKFLNILLPAGVLEYLFGNQV